MVRKKRNMKLSIIMPFVAEYPQAIFTLMSIWNELKNSGIDYEVLAINNWCERVAKQIKWKSKCPQCHLDTEVTRSDYEYMMHTKTRRLDPGLRSLYEGDPHISPELKFDICGNKIRSYAKIHPWLKYLEYSEKLSHWQAKNMGVQYSTGEILFFIDAHCVIAPGSLRNMLAHYCAYGKELNGTLHLPLAYIMERDGVALTYKLLADPEKCLYDYRFTRYDTKTETITKVPCMSTCGMMMSRELYDVLGGWPSELGIYGGGENFINFTLAVLGYDINIFPAPPLHHYAEHRGYNYEYVDYKRNQIIASYVYGGEKTAFTFSQHAKLDEKTRTRVFNEIINKCYSHRNHIAQQQVIAIDEWYRNWKERTNA